MQPSVAIRGHALGRCWGRAGWCVLRLHTPQAALTPRCLYYKQESQQPVKEPTEDSLDTFIEKLQQIVIQPKERRVKHPSKTTKGKSIKSLTHPSRRPYQPYTLRTHGKKGQGLGVKAYQKHIKTDSIALGTITQVDDGDTCSMPIKTEVRDSDKRTKEAGKVPDPVPPELNVVKDVEWTDVTLVRDSDNRTEEPGKVLNLVPPELNRTEDVEWMTETMDEEGNLTCISNTPTPVTYTEQIPTHTSSSSVHEDPQSKENNPHTSTTTHNTAAATAQLTDHSTTHHHTRENHTQRTDDPANLSLPASESEVAGMIEGVRREGKGAVESVKEDKDEGEEGGVVRESEGRALNQKECTLVCLILDGVSEGESRDTLEQCLRKDVAPAFVLLRGLCASASKSAPAKTVVDIQELTKSLHPQQYMQHLGLDYYLAGALCRGGEVDRSLAVLLHLHRHTRPDHYTNPQRKKVADMTQFVLYRIVEEMEDEVSKAVDFVDTIATELGRLGPARSLWSATFTSPLYRIQQVSEWLVERHPGLVRCLGRRMESLVEKAAWLGDQDLLQRSLHFALSHKMSALYPVATSALLQLQCDEGDLRGAEETIKFAQKVEVRVTPAALHRFLALLSRHRRPAPLALLALKYRPPPSRPPVPPPPTPKYRF